MAIKYEANTHAIRTKLWPLIETAFDKPATKSAYKKLVNDFISNRTESLYDTLPCDRILCSEGEMDKIFDVLKVKKQEVKSIISETYYGDIDNFNPLAAKHEFTITMLMIIRYWLFKDNPNKTSNIKISKD